MNVTKKFEQVQKRKTVGMLKAMIKKIENGEFYPISHGFWITGDNEKVFFKVEVLTKDSYKENMNFRQYL